MGHIMASMDEMTVRHRAEIEDQRRHHEVAVADLVSIHKQKIDQLVQDADLEQEVLAARHKEELAAVLNRNDALQQQQDCRVLGREIQQLKEEVRQLRQADQSKTIVIVDLKKTNADLEQRLEDTKVELEKSLQQVSDLKQRSNKSDLESLTPTLPSSSKSVSLEESGGGRAGSSSTASTSFNASILATDPPIKIIAAHSLDEYCDSEHEFSWTQFVFPMAKKNNAYMNQVRP